MQVVGATLAGGLGVGLVLAALAWRWPVLSAPRVTPRAVLREAEQHPSLARLLWSRVNAARVSGFTLGGVFLAAVAGGAVVGLVLWMVRTDTGLARYDLTAARWGAAHATAGSTEALRDLSLVGGTLGSVLIALIVAVVASRRLRPRDVVGFLAIVMIGESILVAGIKAIVDRGRPDVDRLTGFSGASFPSGHAATAAATLAAAALLLGYARTRRQRACLVGVAGGVAATVAATRVLLGVHWLTDVVAGLIVGWSWFAVTSIAFGGRLLRFGEPVEAAERVTETITVSNPHELRSGLPSAAAPRRQKS